MNCRSEPVEGWDEFEGHTPHRPYIDAVKIACPDCGADVQPHCRRGQSLAGCRHRRFQHAAFSRRPELTGKNGIRPTGSRRVSRASSATGSTACWRRAPCFRTNRPFRNLFGYATLLAEDGREMHKSWGNSIEFNEAADTMGADTMRWLYAGAQAGAKPALRLCTAATKPGGSS